jgi:predicted ATPase
MFKRIRLKNFKSYRDSGDVPLAPLTVIIGLNNTGKSALLQALLALKQTAKAPSASFVTTGEYAELNGFNDILHRPQTNGDQTFSVGLTLDSPGSIELPFKVPNDAKPKIADTLEVCFVADQSKGIEVKKSSFFGDGELILGYERGLSQWTSQRLTLSESQKNLFVGLRGFLPVPLARGPLSEPTAQEFVQALNAIAYNAFTWEHLLAQGINRVGPVRSRVPWSVGAGVRTASDLSMGGPNLIAALASEERLPSGNTLLAEVNKWVSDLKLLAKLHSETDKAQSVRMLLADDLSGVSDINVAGMGEGVSQILPVIAQCQLVTKDQCLLVEQPEIHLHPALQADLADLFIGITMQKSQVIVETHSEHIVLRIRRRIAEGTLNRADVRILFVEKIGTDSSIRSLDLDQDGSVAQWPDGFFDEAYTEAMAMVEAAARRH